MRVIQQVLVQKWLAPSWYLELCSLSEQVVPPVSSEVEGLRSEDPLPLYGNNSMLCLHRCLLRSAGVL